VIGLIRRVVFDERGLIRGGLLYIDFSPERTKATLLISPITSVM
jgi:hypothetical protein